MQITEVLSRLCVLSSLVVAVPAFAASPINVWVRGVGNYGTTTADPPKQGLKSIDLDKLPQQQGQRTDTQYGTAAFYRGVALRDVIASYAPPQGTDTVLVHFHNGMIVPLPYREERAMARLDPLIATGRAATAAGPYSGEFPPVSKAVEGFADIRQVAFSGNKMVVKERWHPDQTEQGMANFTPWAITGSVIGLEFVDGTAYFRQFLPNAEVRPGFEIFRQNCQFCHGVRKVGASYGWDYATPLPLHTYRSDAQRLYMHIHYRVEYKQTWQMMPALKHVTEAEAGLLWRWMQAVSGAPITRYTPTH